MKNFNQLGVYQLKSKSATETISSSTEVNAIKVVYFFHITILDTH